MPDELLIRLYLDHNVHTWFATALRRDGYDVVFAEEVGNAHLSDEDLLRWATQQGRAVFTYDRVDYLRLAQDWAMRGETHAGIIVALAPPLLSPAEILHRLRHFLNTIAADELHNQMRWLDPIP
jgi:hypothetical protein